MSLRERAEELAAYLFPQGKRNGREWQIGDVAGNPGGSFSICTDGMKKGAWKDFSTGETGTLLDLWAMHFDFHGSDGWVTRAGEECAAWLGGTFEKRGAEPRTEAPPRNATQRKQTPPTRPVQQRNAVRPVAPPVAKPHPKLPPYTAEWDAAVLALTDPLAGTLAARRGFTMDFVLWLRERKLIGLVQRNGLGPALALPVHDEQGVVIAAHVRNRSTHTDGTPIDPPPPRWQYLYHGDTSPGTRLLIIGDVKKATKLWVFESQWDAFAVMDRMGFHAMPSIPPSVAVLITRGASNARLLQPFIGEGKSLILWPQNDPDAANGKNPAEEWVKSIVELASGAMPVRRVNTPKEHEDPNAWLKACPDVTGVQLVSHITQAIPARPSKLPPLRDMAFAILPENRLVKPPEVICGVARRGDKITIGAPSKGRKTWTLADLAVSVATGTPFWGMDTVQGRVLYLNFELHAYCFDERIALIEAAKGVRLKPGALQSMTLRGITEVIDVMVDELIAYILDMEPFVLIIFDPLYKLMTGRDENKAGDMNLTLAQLEKIAVNTGAAIAIAAHFSKGNQASKDHMDRIGGSGVIGRDGDVIITMTENETPDAMTITSSLRSYAPMEPFAIRWGYPIFQRDATIDPAELKLPPRKDGSRPSSRMDGPPRQRANSSIPAACAMMAAIWPQLPRSARMLDFVAIGAERGKDTNGEPLKPGTAKSYFYKLKDAEYIVKDEARGVWITTKKGDDYLDNLDRNQQPTT